MFRVSPNVGASLGPVLIKFGTVRFRGVERTPGDASEVSRQHVSRFTTRPYSPDDSLTFNRFRMTTASGRTVHVEVRARRRLDEHGQLISTGVMRDIEERARLEQRLMEETARLRAVFDSVGATLLLLDRDGRILIANSEMTNVFGFASDRIVGRHVRDVFTDLQFLQGTVAEWRVGPLSPEHLEGVRYEQALVDRQGRNRTHGVTVNPIADETGILSQFVVVGVDDTERREALDLLKETIDTVPAGIVIYDQQERLVMFNEAAKAATPVLRRPGVIGISYADLAKETAKLAAEFGAPLQNTPEEWVERFRSKGAKTMRQSVEGRWFEWSEKLTPLGRTVGLRVDVTDLKTRELELERARAQYQALVDSLSDVVYALDRKGRLNFVSAAAAELFGVPPEQLLGKPVVDYMEPDQVKQAVAAGRDLLLSTDNSMRQIRSSLRRPDGTIRQVEVRFRKPAGGVSDEVVQVGVIRDITDRLETEQALFDAERLTTVGEMAATLAHEISQPLQVISIARAAAADELAQARESNAAIDAKFVDGRLTRIDQQVDRAARIVNELRAFVRGTGEEQAAPFDPRLAVQSAIDLTSHSVLQARSVLSSSLEPDLPLLQGHVGRLEQVLVNLINNARDAGAPRIEIVAGSLQRDGHEFVRIAAEDTGPGIAAHVLPRLFESFITTKPRGKGTGLGLRICRRIVEEMGGTITASNRSEGGACFEILLPVAPAN